MHPRERQLLHAMVRRRVRRPVPPARHRARRDDVDRDRDRLLDRVRGCAAGVPLGTARAALRQPLRALLHDPEHRLLPDHGADHRHRLAEHRDRARVLHAADPLSQHADRAQGGAGGRQGSGRGHGPHACADADAGRAAAGRAGHRRGPSRRDGHDDLARHDRGVHHAARARGADLQRAAHRRQHRVRRREPPGNRAGADRRRADRRAPVGAHAVGAGTEAVGMSDLVEFFIDNPVLLFEKALSHMGISALAIGIALVVALPVGVLLGHKHRGSYVAINVSNVLRALPSLALIAISLAIFGLSTINILIALVVLAVPPILTNAYTAVDNVDPDAVEAARGMGMSERGILAVIELPLSWPLIFAGIRTGAVYVIATAPLAAIAGGGGLGDIIVNQPTYRLVGVIAATIVPVALAFPVDGLLALAQRKLTPAGLTAPTELQTLPLAKSELPSADTSMVTH